MDLGDLDEALYDANHAVSTQPDAMAYFLRVRIHDLRGDDERCLIDFGHASSAGPGCRTLSGAGCGGSGRRRRGVRPM